MAAEGMHSAKRAVAACVQAALIAYARAKGNESHLVGADLEIVEPFRVSGSPRRSTSSDASPRCDGAANLN
jgi:hypothetical protein